MPSSESQTADQYVNQKDDMHGNADGDLLRQTVRLFKLGLAHIQKKQHLRLNTRWCRIYALGSSEVAALGRWTTLDYFEPNAVHLHVPVSVVLLVRRDVLRPAKM